MGTPAAAAGGQKRVILAGLPRSGTTLLATLLAAQPGVHFATDYFPSFREAARHLEVGWDRPLGETQRRIALAIVRDQMLRVRHPVLVRPDQFQSLEELHRLVMRELSPAPIVGHKLLFPAEELGHVLAETGIFFLVMLRDPRDAAISYFHRTGGGVEAYVRNWSATARVTKRLATHPRLLTLRFEDLVRDPPRTLERLGDFLGAPISADVPQLRFQRGAAGGVAWHENSAFQDVTKRFDTAPLGRHETLAASALVRYSDWACRRELPSWGYQRRLEPLSLKEQLQFRALSALERSERVGRELLSDAAQTMRRRLPELAVPKPSA